MTLVLPLIAKDHVILCADRRITGPGGDVFDDLRNKLVLYDDRFVFGFTGIAEIEGMRVDHWIARCLSLESNFESAVEAMRLRANRVFRQMGRCPQAFVAVGWVSYRGAEVAPFSLYVSNAWDSNLARWVEPRDMFKIEMFALRPDHSWQLHYGVGVSLALHKVQAIRNLVRPAMKRRRDVVCAGLLLGHGIRMVARGADTVSPTSTCVVLPRPRLGRQRRIFFPTQRTISIAQGYAYAFDISATMAPPRWNPPLCVEHGAYHELIVRRQPNGALRTEWTKHVTIPGVPSAVEYGHTDGEQSLIRGTDGKTRVEDLNDGE